ncbi:hypothetical protein FA95DRAFT_1503064 [Auriscalpium vulgare]|uniref:Uncharacterized protein n=1 Tax=Auriscalpium vulgare TaxID=40419 RepID=A0ACB8R949_9AGAM|nr:hypothetical protein FA95DRAFT_1503064 [Auriscalpium vulgare]
MTASRARPRILYSPRFISYIALTLDPVATASIYGDSIATALAAEMPLRTYVGFVEMTAGLPSPHRRYHLCRCRLLSKGLPDPDPTRGIDETFCVPVGTASHPSGRKPINPSPPLPVWGDLYHHTMVFQELRLPTEYHDYSASPRLSNSDMATFELAAFTDGRDSDRAAAIYRAQHGDTSSSGSSPSPSSPASHPTGTSSLSHAAAAPGHNPAGTHLRADSGAGITPNGRVLTDVFLDAVADINLSNDESTISPIGSPGKTSWRLSEVAPDGGDWPTPDRNMTFDSAGDIALGMAQDYFGFENPRKRFTPIANYSLDLSSIEEISDGRLLVADCDALRK